MDDKLCTPEQRAEFVRQAKERLARLPEQRRRELEYGRLRAEQTARMHLAGPTIQPW